MIPLHQQCIDRNKSLFEFLFWLEDEYFKSASLTVIAHFFMCFVRFTYHNTDHYDLDGQKYTVTNARTLSVDTIGMLMICRTINNI